MSFCVIDVFKCKSMTRRVVIKKGVYRTTVELLPRFYIYVNRSCHQ